MRSFVSMASAFMKNRVTCSFEKKKTVNLLNEIKPSELWALSYFPFDVSVFEVWSLVFICRGPLFWKIYLLFAILWNFKRPITNYNLSDEITWGYLTKISGSDDLWWSLQLWDNIEKISLGKNPVGEFRNSVQHLSRYTFFFFLNGCQRFREVLLAKTDSFQGEMIN